MAAFDSRSFGRRLAAARVWRGLEPKQVANALGVSAEAINRWERGGLTRPPAKGQLRLLAEVLEQPESWILGGEVPPWQSTAEASEGTEDLRDLIERRSDEILEELKDLKELARVRAVSRDG